MRPSPDKENEHTDHNEPDNTMAVGNADDFVDDEDKDSEDVQEMDQRREKTKEIVCKQNEQDVLLNELGKKPAQWILSIGMDTKLQGNCRMTATAASILKHWSAATTIASPKKLQTISDFPEYTYARPQLPYMGIIVAVRPCDFSACSYNPVRREERKNL